MNQVHERAVPESTHVENPDVILIGSGIMSANLGAMLKRLDPSLRIQLYEVTEKLTQESSHGWNNAGTGHAGMCELSYTPKRKADGTVNIAKAVQIFEQFEQSKQFWSYAVASGMADNPKEFINLVPHLSFVYGQESTDDLREYFEEFSGEFAGTSDKTTIADCYHGDIIRALRKKFKGHAIRKSVGIDLFAYKGRKALLFEAKTSSDPQSIFTAVGQLTIHTIAVEASMRDLTLTKVLVVPQIPSARLALALKKLHIKVLTYKRLDSGRIVLGDCMRIQG